MSALIEATGPTASVCTPTETIDFSKVVEQMNPVIANHLEELLEPCDLEKWEEKCLSLVDTLREVGDEECPFPYVHQFSDGIYYRQVSKGPFELVVGSRHRFEHQNILVTGDQVVLTNEGPIIMRAPYPFTASAGSRKVTLTLTDVVFANVFKNPENLRDVDELERFLTYPEKQLIEGVKT